MDDFVQYHNSEGMGISCLDLDVQDEYRIFTNKAVKNMIGNRIWLIGG